VAVGVQSRTRSVAAKRDASREQNILASPMGKNSERIWRGMGDGVRIVSRDQGRTTSVCARSECSYHNQNIACAVSFGELGHARRAEDLVRWTRQFGAGLHCSYRPGSFHLLFLIKTFSFNFQMVRVKKCKA
jgi:class 3 adenylate cyclase